MCLTAIPGVASSIPARSHTFVEIDHEIILRSFSSLPLIHSRRVVVSYNTIAVDLGRKATKQRRHNHARIQKVGPSLTTFFYI